MRRINDLVHMRPLARPDIPGRVAVLADPLVRRNISGLFALYDDRELTRFFVDIVDGHHPSRMEFVLCKKDGKVIGYTYLLGIDQPNRRCEIAMIILPEYRFGYGLAATVKTYDYAFGVLNIRCVLNEVHAENVMMANRDVHTTRAQAVGINAHFTEGRLGENYLWTETPESFHRHFGRYLSSDSEDES